VDLQVEHMWVMQVRVTDVPHLRGCCCCTEGESVTLCTFSDYVYCGVTTAHDLCVYGS
jgi:hypothetical protein